MGTPLLIRKTRTTEHLIDGEGLWLKEGTVEELVEKLTAVLSYTPDERAGMRASSKKILSEISYRNVAKRFLADVEKYKNK